MYHLLQRVYPYLPVQHSDLRLHQRTWFCQAFAPTATTFARTSALLIEKRNTMCIGLQGRKNKYALFWPCRFFYAAGTTAQIQVKVGHEHLHLNKAEHFLKRGSKILQFCIFSFFFLICRVCCSITLFQPKDWPQIIACFVGMLCMLCKRRLQKMHVLICFLGCLPCMLFKQIFTNGLQQHPAFLQRFGANQSLQATRP